MEMEWTYTHTERGEVVFEMDVSLLVSVSGGEASIDNVYVPTMVAGNFMSLKHSDTAFGKALYEQIYLTIENDDDFQTQAIEMWRDAA